MNQPGEPLSGVQADDGPRASTVPPPRLPSPERAEAEVAQALAAQLAGLDWSAVRLRAQPWVEAVRRQPAPWLALESLLHDYPLGSAEGRALMRLAESLLRVPDTDTAALLAADQLGQARFDARHLAAASRHPQLAGWAARAMNWARDLLPAADGAAVETLAQRLGTPAVVAAATQAVQWLGRQFVLGRDIDEALREAATARQQAGAPLRYSFDMLGEGARSVEDADRYLAAYRHALQRVAASAPAGSAVEAADGLSIKLSALHPRFEELQHARVLPELLPRLWSLIEPAAHAGIPVTLDAEEADRLELTLDVFDALARRVAAQAPHWRGLGLALQAYQTRSREAVDEVLRIAAHTGIRPMVRLVKGAYWDAEIKRAQQLGLAAYPVFTHKAHTDLAYLAGAQALLAAGPAVYPQFASHHAGTLAAVLQMAQHAGLPLDGSAFELQRLHGMGQAVFAQLARDAAVGGRLPVRVYAPVGAHRELLAYLVRRMLENGANTSFVHQLANERLPADVLLASPFISPLLTPLSPALEPPRPQEPPAPGWSAGRPSAGLRVHEPPAVRIPLPADLYGPLRRNARGIDLACRATRRALLDAVQHHAAPGAVAGCDVEQVGAVVERLHAAWPAWDARSPAERADVLDRAADLLQARLSAFCALLVHEAGKTLADAVAEVREAVDACRYYAAQARADLAPRLLPGPTGERNEWRLRGRGVLACIAPWNFPLAIFGAQVAAALVAGNTVAAKPAEQTPAVARAFVDLLTEAGVPRDALALLHGPGSAVGERLLRQAHLAGVVFTGSTATARRIQRVLAERDGPILPLVAETGGVNAMIVDGTALPEQAVEAIVASAFGSAGQRCSALRLLCVEASVADALLQQLAGAIRLLHVGDPADAATDVGPLIDAAAHAAVQAHVERLSAAPGVRLLAQAPLPPAGLLPADLAARLLAPSAWLIDPLGDDGLAWVRQEVFGPVLHVLRWGPGCAIGDVDALVDAINGLGYGLTLGVQTRIDSRARRIAQRARVGNVYVNRGMTGAVIGVQPFGGEGLSGTGPKAGGPLYLPRLCVEQTVTLNTAAAGGNLDLLGG